MTLGSNKLKENTIYDEKQRVAITEQRQYDLLSNVVSNSWFTIQCVTGNEIKYRQTFSFKPRFYSCSISIWLSVSTHESSAVAIVKIHDLFSN